jgi:hypothetical protein
MVLALAKQLEKKVNYEPRQVYLMQKGQVVYTLDLNLHK